MYDAMNLKSIYKDATDVIDGYKKRSTKSIDF